MKIVFSSFLILFSLVIILSSCQSKSSKSAKENIEYIYNDLKPDEFYPAAQVELQIKSSGSTMYGFA